MWARGFRILEKAYEGYLALESLIVTYRYLWARGFRILEEAYEGYLALDDVDGQLRVLKDRAIGLWDWGDKAHRQEV